MNPDRLAELESERRFLLRSLDDLERERSVGDVDQADYLTLRDGYIARAAVVLRELEDGRRDMPVPRPRRRGRAAVLAASVLVGAVGSGWLVARESGQRLPGQVATGGSIDDRPSVLLSRARATGLNEPMVTLELYDRVLAVDPDNVEALSYRAWVLALISAGASPEVLDVALNRARSDLRRARDLDSNYADAWCFSGILALRAGDSEGQVRSYLERCLEADPPSDIRSLAEDVLTRLAG